MTNTARDLVPSPCYVIDEALLLRNLEIMADVQARAGCKIITALKATASWRTFPLQRQFLAGSTASSLNEARLASEEFGGDVHVYAPAYRDDEIEGILAVASHVSFNSFGQWRRFRDLADAAGVSCGIRINPEYSESHCLLYNPCAPHSRLGVVRSELGDLDGIEGLHFHALCDTGAEALVRLLAVIEERFGDVLPRMKWVNFGGGHLMTRPGYDVDLLIETVKAFRAKWGVDVIIEPGSAVAYGAGFLVCTVLDVAFNGMPTVIVDTSATAHMPEIVETPYRPTIQGAGHAGEKAWTCRIGGATCLSGDIMGDYSFDRPLEIGDRLVLLNQMQYTMVRSTTFNGIRHPAIAVRALDGTVSVQREFCYQDYKGRLG